MPFLLPKMGLQKNIFIFLKKSVQNICTVFEVYLSLYYQTAKAIKSHLKFKIMNIDELAKRYGCSVEQLKNQYAANADGLERMYNKAVQSGKKVNGYTAEQLLLEVKKYRALSTSN